jgi:hypothetical protein
MSEIQEMKKPLQRPQENRLDRSTIVLSGIGFIAAILAIGLITDANSASPALAQQQQKNLNTKLVGTNEVPPVNTKATGSAKFTLSTDRKSLDYVLNVTNMSGIVGAHIHSGKQGQNGPVIAGLFNPSMTGPPTGKANGVLSKGIIISSNLQGPLAGKQISDLVNLMNSQGTYVNIHTQQNKNGEIRGQISSVVSNVASINNTGNNTLGGAVKTFLNQTGKALVNVPGETNELLSGGSESSGGENDTVGK